MPFEELLDAVPGLGRLDVLVAGGASAQDFRRRLPVYQRHRREGFCGARAIGASFHDRRAAQRAVKAGQLEIAFTRYNPDHTGARKDLFPSLGQHAGTLLYNFKSRDGFVAPGRLAALGVGRDLWHPRLQDHYRYVLSRPALDGVLFSLRKVGEVQALVRALEEGALLVEEEAYLEKLAALQAGRAQVAPP